MKYVHGEVSLKYMKYVYGEVSLKYMKYVQGSARNWGNVFDFT